MYAKDHMRGHDTAISCTKVLHKHGCLKPREILQIILSITRLDLLRKTLSIEKG